MNKNLIRQYILISILLFSSIFLTSNTRGVQFLTSGIITGQKGLINLNKPLEGLPAALSKCKNDPYAPCYTTVWVPSDSDGAMSVLSNLSCGRNVYNGLGTLIAQIWSNATVSWNYPLPINFWLSNMSTGTWSVGGLYGWANVVNPYGNGATNGAHQYSIYGYQIKSTGDVTYLGVPWTNVSAIIEIGSSAYSYSCK